MMSNKVDKIFNQYLVRFFDLLHNEQQRLAQWDPRVQSAKSICDIMVTVMAFYAMSINTRQRSLSCHYLVAR